MKKNPFTFNANNLKNWIIIYIPKFSFDKSTSINQFVIQFEKSFPDVPINKNIKTHIFNNLYYFYYPTWNSIDLEKIPFNKKINKFKTFVNENYTFTYRELSNIIRILSL